MNIAEQSKKPIVFATNTMLHLITGVQYPVLTRLDNTDDLFVVAVVTATSTKIDFWIDVIHALRVKPLDLLLYNEWVTKFEAGSENEIGTDVKGDLKGWTEQIIQAALEPYEAQYNHVPYCMVGVFDKENERLFWETFDRLYPNKQMADFDEQIRANIAAQCIRHTPFWRPREKHGYTRLEFEVDALAKKAVFVRTYLGNLSNTQIQGIARTEKTHPYLKRYDNWVFAGNGPL